MTLNSHGTIDRAGIRDGAPIGFRERDLREALPGDVLLQRMNVLGFPDIDEHGHASVGDRERHRLRLAQLGPV